MASKFTTRLLTTGAAGLLIGATVLAPRPAHALFGSDAAELAALIAAVKTVASDVTNFSGELQNEVASEFGYPASGGGSIHTTLDKGFTQLTETMRGQVGAQQQNADAVLNDQAVQARQYRDIHVRDQHIILLFGEFFLRRRPMQPIRGGI